MRHLLVLPLLALLAACGDDPVLPTPEEVGGIYQVCSLAFTPGGGTLPAVNLRAAAIDTTLGTANPALLTLSTQQGLFELQYTPKGDVLAQRPAGTYTTATGAVTLAFTDPARVASALLLPARVRLETRTGPKALVVPESATAYRVPRADYARLAGISQTNLPAEIEGTLSGRFVVTGSPCN